MRQFLAERRVELFCDGERRHHARLEVAGLIAEQDILASLERHGRAPRLSRRPVAQLFDALQLVLLDPGAIGCPLTGSRSIGQAPRRAASALARWVRPSLCAARGSHVAAVPLS